MKRVLFAALVAGLAASVAQAQYTTVDLSGVVNGGRPVINGSTFPYGNQTFAGVPFAMLGSSDVDTHWAWYAHNAAGGTNAVVTATIPVGVYGVSDVYSLMNTLWGQYGPSSYASITFNGSAGTSYTYNLVGNWDIRDYNQSFFWTNSINNTTTIQVFNNNLGQRLDRQHFALPAAFLTQTLDTVVIRDTGGANFQRVFLAGLTVSSVPAPAGASLIGLGLLAASRRRRY
jgi:hypothetical protein